MKMLAANRGTILGFSRRLRSKVRRDGIGGLALAVWWQSWRRVNGSKRQERLLDGEFDRAHGVDTAGVISLYSLNLPNQENLDHGLKYQGINPNIFRKMMGALPAIDFSKFVFIDYGSGKGRALLLAAEYPFSRIIGVEFAPELHMIAKRNIQAYRNSRQVCRAIQSICADATTYELPADPAVIYIYNPFDAVLMTRVLENVAVSLAAHPRQLYLLVSGESLQTVVAGAGFRRLVQVSPGQFGTAIFANSP
jgi:predicted RNA methylase